MGKAQELATASRPMRPVCVVSPAARLPETVCGGHAQVGSENEKVLVPPVNVTVSVNEMGVPQTKEGDVLTENGTVLVAVAFSAVLG